MRNLGGEIVFNHADYRLLSRRALDALAKYPERNMFLRGIIPMVGYKSDIVYYERGERFAGESKYPLKKMIAFAIDGITSLSVKPLRLIGLLGTLLFVIGLISMIITLVLSNSTAAIITSIWSAAGLILAGLGITGEYIGKIYLETKNRPRFFIETNLDENT